MLNIKTAILAAFLCSVQYCQEYLHAMLQITNTRLCLEKTEIYTFVFKNSQLPDPKTLKTTVLLSVPVGVTTSSVPWKWHRLAFVIFWLAYCTWHSVFTHGITRQNLLSFLQDEQSSIVCPGYIRFIHSSIGGHLSPSHLLSSVTSAALNMGMQMSLFSHVCSQGLGLHPAVLCGSCGSSV